MTKKQTVKQVRTPVQQPADVGVVKVAEERAVPKWRQCPLCYTGYGGVGTCYAKRARKRYYKCTTCGYNWSVDMELRVVEFQHPAPGDE